LAILGLNYTIKSGIDLFFLLAGCVCHHFARGTHLDGVSFPLATSLLCLIIKVRWLLECFGKDFGVYGQKDRIKKIAWQD
jgi:hypothetical protein